MSKLGRKIMNSQSREPVSNVYKFIKEEADQKEVKIVLIKARKQAVEATGFSELVITKINKELLEKLC